MPKTFNKKTRQIKAALALRGQTAKAWALSNCFPVTTVHQAIHGKRAGRVSQSVLKKLEELSHV